MSDLPAYYRKSKVMNMLFRSIESEYKRLRNEVTLTENQFFVILAGKNIQNHEQDVGVIPDEAADLETRRGRVLSKLRGTGTVTKTMMKNVAASFVNGDIEITEYPSRYMFSVAFTSKQGVPYNLQDIKDMIEEIKPAHLAVEYIFTYRLWEDVKNDLQNWTMVKPYTWEELLTFHVRHYLTVTESGIYFCPEAQGNARVVWDGKKAYARRIDENG